MVSVGVELIASCAAFAIGFAAPWALRTFQSVGRTIFKSRQGLAAYKRTPIFITLAAQSLSLVLFSAALIFLSYATKAWPPFIVVAGVAGMGLGRVIAKV